jgi:hypothetical protein
MLDPTLSPIFWPKNSVCGLVHPHFNRAALRNQGHLEAIQTPHWSRETNHFFLPSSLSLSLFLFASWVSPMILIEKFSKCLLSELMMSKYIALLRIWTVPWKACNQSIWNMIQGCKLNIQFLERKMFSLIICYVGMSLNKIILFINWCPDPPKDNCPSYPFG